MLAWMSCSWRDTDAIRNELKAARVELQEARSALEHEKQLRCKGQEELRTTRRGLRDAEANNHELRSRLNDAQRLSETELRAKVRVAVADRDAEVQRFRREVERLTAVNADFSAKLHTSAQRANNAVEEARGLHTTLREAQLALEDAQADREREVRLRLREAHNEIAHLKNDLASKSVACDTLSRRTDELVEELAGLRDMNRRLEAEVSRRRTDVQQHNRHCLN